MQQQPRYSVPLHTQLLIPCDNNFVLAKECKQLQHIQNKAFVIHRETSSDNHVLTALVHTATLTQEKYSWSIHYSEHCNSVVNVTAFFWNYARHHHKMYSEFIVTTEEGNMPR